MPAGIEVRGVQQCSFKKLTEKKFSGFNRKRNLQLPDYHSKKLCRRKSRAKTLKFRIISNYRKESTNSNAGLLNFCKGRKKQGIQICGFICDGPFVFRFRCVFFSMEYLVLSSNLCFVLLQGFTICIGVHLFELGLRPGC